MVRLSVFTYNRRGQWPFLILIIFIGSFTLAAYDSATPFTLSGTATSTIETTIPPTNTLPATTSTTSGTAKTLVPVSTTPTTAIATASVLTPSTSLNTLGPTLDTTPASTLPDIDIETAWGKNLPIYDVSTVMPDKTHTFTFITATPDAKFMFGEIASPKFGIEAQKVILLNVTTQEITVLQQFSDPMSQVLGGAADANWIVWAVAAQQPGLSDWILYSYNRQTQKVVSFAKAPTAADGSFLPSPFILPTLDHGIVVWNEAGTDPSGTVRNPTVVKSFDLNTGQQKVLATNGHGPVIAWPNVAWVQGLNTLSTVKPGAFNASLVVENLETSAQKTLPFINTPSYFDICGESIIWVDETQLSLYLSDFAGTKPQLIVHTDDPSDYIQFPTINERLITWVSYKTNQVWDRVQKRVVTLSDISSFVQLGSWESNNMAHGNAFVWFTINGNSPASVDKFTPSSNRIFRIVDSTQLPLTAPDNHTP